MKLTHHRHAPARGAWRTIAQGLPLDDEKRTFAYCDLCKCVPTSLLGTHYVMDEGITLAEWEARKPPGFIKNIADLLAQSNGILDDMETLEFRGIPIKMTDTILAAEARLDSPGSRHDFSKPFYDANGNAYEACCKCGMDRMLIELEGKLRQCESATSLQQGLSLLNQIK